MKRIIMMVLRNLFRVPSMWIRLNYHAKHTEKYTDEEQYELLKYIVKRANKGGNVTIEAHGVENIPKENGFMFYPNHQGLYDVLAIMDACPVPFSVVAKKEVENTPFLKQVFACMKAYMLDRENVRSAMQTIMNVVQEVKNGRNYLIFPEGTRSKNGNVVGEFKPGSFKAAEKAKATIVPVALINAFEPFDRKSIKKVKVQVHFLPAIPYETYKELKTPEIAVSIRNDIQNVINENI